MKHYSPRRRPPSGPPLTPITGLAAVSAERARRAAEAQSYARQHAVDQSIEASRERCKTLSGFVREAWHVLERENPYIHGWHIDATNEHLEAVSYGHLQHVLFNVPPGSMKSLSVSVMFPAWEWGPRGLSAMRYLSGAYEQALAFRDNRKMRQLVLSPWFQERWPMTLTKNGDELFENAMGGNRWARAFNSMTGGRGDRVLIDDPHSTTTAESPQQRATTVRTFREGITDRLNNPRTSSIILMMQRLHTQDVTGAIEELGLNFERVVIPMEFEPQRARTTSIGWKDPRKYDGELMCPERWGPADIKELKKAKGTYAWAGQYQQRPTPREGGLFKREWFDEDQILDAAPPFVLEVRWWDLADTDLTATDMVGARSAGVRMGITADQRIVVVHSLALGEEGVIKSIKATAAVDGKHVKVGIPQDPGQAGKVVKRSHMKALNGFTVLARRETGDKVSRAEPLSTQAEAKNVFLVRGPWNQEWIDEVCNFPGGARKDIVDASSGAYGLLLEADTAKGDGLAGPEEIQHDAGDGREAPARELTEDDEVWA